MHDFNIFAISSGSFPPPCPVIVSERKAFYSINFMVFFNTQVLEITKGSLKFNSHASVQIALLVKFVSSCQVLLSSDKCKNTLIHSLLLKLHCSRNLVGF